MFFCWFWVGKMKFHHSWSPHGKMFLVTTWKDPLLSSLEKILPTPMNTEPPERSAFVSFLQSVH